MCAALFLILLTSSKAGHFLSLPRRGQHCPPPELPLSNLYFISAALLPSGQVSHGAASPLHLHFSHLTSSPSRRGQSYAPLMAESLVPCPCSFFFNPGILKVLPLSMAAVAKPLAIGNFISQSESGCRLSLRAGHCKHVFVFVCLFFG